ncbi:uncharacterized protein LOC100833801 [Brachypodium distachyon]|uniref:Uncharacterized protein n=1 Tax=Brachypodium distachyon TaxID=15368 RepID=I1I9E9_BRADI|nr:uncharacterized protein LOC100833801 [Brachypodium distachyon]KQJ99344.1 hypothetical protein BRADI_3g42740v3 [Brachypodium distachyon]|eukprot:XP_003572499.1 uncharacterized protein LOC100833801 [Brachypodium distachyon]
MRELSCFREAAVCAASPASVSGTGGLDRSLQAATTSVYRAQLASGKGILIRVTWTRSSAAAAGIAAIAFSDQGSSVLFSSPSSSSARAQQHVLRRKRGSRGFVTGAGTAMGVHWDVAAAEYASAPSSPEPSGGDYCLAVVADAELVLLLGSGDLACRLSSSLSTATTLVSRREQLRSTAAAVIHATQCRFREGGEEHSVSVRVTAEGEGEVGVSIDGEEVAVARQLRWGFRGNRAAVLPDGEVVDVMWDVHDWWFGCRGGDGKGAQFMVRARSEKEGRLWMADQTAPAATEVVGTGGGFFLHVQCYRR